MFPVFSHELLLAERRGRYGKLQSRYLKWLVFLCLLAMWRLLDEPVLHQSWTDFFLQLSLIQHAALVFFLTPAFLAGAIADERRQGTLADLLTTDLSPAEILFGKLFAALAQLITLLLMAAPPLAFCAGCGFLQPAAIPGLVLLTALWLLLLGSLSLCASVFSSLARRAVLRVYGLVAATFLFIWMYRDLVLPWLQRRLGPSINLRWARELGEWLHCLDPFFVLRPLYLDADWDVFSGRLFRFSLIATVVGVVAFAAAVSRLRSRCVPAPIRRRTVAGTRPQTLEIGDRPILWRESLVSRPWWRGLGVLLAFLLGLAGAWYAINLEDPWSVLLWGSISIAFIASLLAGVQASGAITVEREAKTWDSLLATPIDSDTLVREKASAAVRNAGPFLLAPCVPVLVVAGLYAWMAIPIVLVIVYLGRELSRYMAAAGLVSSARAHGSWRGLLMTLVSGYSRILLFLAMIGAVCVCYGTVFSYFFLFLLAFTHLTEVNVIGVFVFVSGLFCAAAFSLWLRRTATRDLAAAARLVERERRET